MFNLKDLSNCREDDIEKIEMIDEVANSSLLLCSKNLMEDKLCESVFYSKSHVAFTKYCPECGRKFPERENVCMDCLVHLRNISDAVEVRDVISDPQFPLEGKTVYSTFDELLSDENILKINRFDFAIRDFEDIIHDIKSQVFRNFDALVKSNEIFYDSLDISDKILLFAKSIVKVEYKSSGGQLGYYVDKTIYVDDRQTESLQITTLLHELSHFLLQEIITRILCKILDTSKNSFVETLAVYVLSFDAFTRLIDEYSAHNVEGRFTLFGYQDYSSFFEIEAELDGRMSAEEIDITKSIGNNFAIYIKEILEALIDRPLRDEIKDQFMNDRLERPNFKALEMENCKKLYEEGFMKAVWLMLHDGCEAAGLNKDKLISLNSEFTMIFNVPDELEYDVQGEKVMFKFNNLSTSWMSPDDPFIRRIGMDELNEERLSGHIEKEIEIKNTLDRGIALYGAAKYPKAVEVFDDVLFYDENYACALLYKSYSLRGQKHFVKSLRNYRRAVRVDESLKDMEYYRAVIGEANNERDNFPKLKLNIYTGDELFGKGEFERAILSYDKALANPSKFKDKILSKLLNKKATALVKLERYGEALECFENSFEVDGNDYSIFGAGLCRYNLKLPIDDKFRSILHINKRQMLKQAMILNDSGYGKDALNICDYLWKNHFKKDEFYFKLAKARESCFNI